MISSSICKLLSETKNLCMDLALIQLIIRIAVNQMSGQNNPVFNKHKHWDS